VIPATGQLAARVLHARAYGLATRRRRVPASRWPALIESDYAARLVGMLRPIRAMMLSAIGVRHDDDAKANEASTTADTLRRKIANGSADGVAREFGDRVSKHQRDDITRQAKAGLGVDVVFVDSKIEPLLRGFVRENVAEIKRLQGRCVDDLEAVILRAYAGGVRAEDIAAEIADRYQMSEAAARRLARDQIGKLNSRVTMARHEELGIKRFGWQSMRDNRVRPAHRHLHGMVFEYGSPPREGYPGMPWGCRCLQKPIMDDIHAELDALGVSRRPRATRRR
jgi:SPP1 gp7 family putative phage head morphogenesis protein